MADLHQISKTTPSEGIFHETNAISIFTKCGKCRVFANPVTYMPVCLCVVCGASNEKWVSGIMGKDMWWEGNK